MTGPAPTGEPPRGRPADFLTELFRTPLDPGYAHAARKRAAGAPPPRRWQRLTARGTGLVALVTIGFLLAVSYRYAVAAQPETSRARAGLVADVRARRAAADDLQKRADLLREQVVRARDEALADSDESARLRNLEAATGLAPVRGDGLVVRVVDAPPPVDPVTGRQSATNPGRVLDRDLQDISNDLWRLGAEAIAINGERLTATSTIRAAGGAILVDFKPVTAPYEVAAIGPGDLRDAFDGSATARRFRDYVSTYRMRFSVDRRTGMTLAAAVQPGLRYAQPPQSSPAASPSSRPSAVPSGSRRPAASPVPSASGGRR
ncbi:DUF881 domain-containing protein [Planosporangium mesophilum]|uniref:Membrane protein n=1 Tax=Planosporangium mesophilum TaxID=689768 RepID=A0A8J3X134_9ACTN|nr:DUF881 domain-containing protein [Planosporangium mesophilum]NJC86167.1 DUF881 domain-containing protein [Planosporangium mesophilum]GII22984.1 membrane protein [Planosporangium mesophilum]